MDSSATESPPWMYKYKAPKYNTKRKNEIQVFFYLFLERKYFYSLKYRF